MTTQAHPQGKTKVFLELIGTDSHAFSILGNFQKAAKQQGFNKEWIDEVIEKAKSKNYDMLLATIVSHCTTEFEDIPVEDDNCPKDYQPTFWENEDPLSEESSRIFAEYIPITGEPLDENGDLIPVLEFFRNINRLYHDLYNNGLGNDKRNECQFLVDNLDMVFPFMSPQHEKQVVFNLLNFIIDTKDKEDQQGESCDWCCGEGGDYQEYGTGEYEDDGDEIMEEEWSDCDYCDGSGYQEEEYIDFLEWFEEKPERMRSLDRLASATIRMVLDAEQKGTITKKTADA